MHTVVSDDHVVSCICSVSLSCTKTAAEFEVLFGTKTPDGTRNIVLDGGLDPPVERAVEKNFA